MSSNNYVFIAERIEGVVLPPKTKIVTIGNQRYLFFYEGIEHKELEKTVETFMMKLSEFGFTGLEIKINDLGRIDK